MLRIKLDIDRKSKKLLLLFPRFICLPYSSFYTCKINRSHSPLPKLSKQPRTWIWLFCGHSQHCSVPLHKFPKKQCYISLCATDKYLRGKAFVCSGWHDRENIKYKLGKDYFFRKNKVDINIQQMQISYASHIVCLPRSRGMLLGIPGPETWKMLHSCQYPIVRVGF